MVNVQEKPDHLEQRGGLSARYKIHFNYINKMICGTDTRKDKSMEQNIYVYVYVYTHENLVFNRSDISIQGKVLGTIDIFANFVGFIY